MKFCTLLKLFHQINIILPVSKKKVHEYSIWCSLGPNGQVTYGGILEEDFNINPVTGVITTTKVLDRELREYYTVTGEVLKHHKEKCFKIGQVVLPIFLVCFSQFMPRMEDSPLITPKPQ